MTVQVAAVIFLVIHLTVCVMAVIMKKSGKIKSAHMILPAVFLVPVCGCFLSMNGRCAIQEGRLKMWRIMPMWRRMSCGTGRL